MVFSGSFTFWRNFARWAGQAEGLHWRNNRRGLPNANRWGNNTGNKCWICRNFGGRFGWCWYWWWFKRNDYWRGRSGRGAWKWYWRRWTGGTSAPWRRRFTQPWYWGAHWQCIWFFWFNAGRWFFSWTCWRWHKHTKFCRQTGGIIWSGKRSGRAFKSVSQWACRNGGWIRHKKRKSLETAENWSYGFGNYWNGRGD